MANIVVSAETSTSNVRPNVMRRRAHRGFSLEEEPFWGNIFSLEPTVFYEGELSSFTGVRHFFLAGAVIAIIPPPGSGTGRGLEPIISDVLSLSLTEWPGLGYSTFWGSWVNPRGTFQEGSETTVALPTEGMPYERISIGGTAQSYYTADQALANLQTANPGAVERIRKLAKLEPGWYDYGSIPPTEEAVKTTARLLLVIHRLTRGLLESPFIAPLPDGGLELEWELDSGVELMLVIPPSGTDIRYLLDEPTSSGDIIKSEGIVPKDMSLSELISRLTCGQSSDASAQIYQLARKYPKLSMELIKHHVNNREPRAGRSEAQKKQLLSLIGLFEGSSDLSERLDEN